MEIIPAVDILRGRCVRLIQGRLSHEIVYSRDPVAMAMRWEREGAKRLHVVDLDAAFSGRPVNRKIIMTIARVLSIPVQAGGGVRTLRDIEYYLRGGVERVILGTKAMEDKKFLSTIDKKFFKNILISLDVRDGRAAVRGWRKVSRLTAISAAREMDELGVSGIIYTDISRDGMLSGPNLKFMLALLEEVKLSLFISGGVSSLSDIKKIKEMSRGRVRGVIIGQALYNGNIKLRDAIKSL